MAWQQASGYTKRARAETAVGRWKRVIGDRLRAHTEERRATEVDVSVHVLNRMLELGRPNYVRVGRPLTGLGPPRPFAVVHAQLPRCRGTPGRAGLDLGLFYEAA